MKTWLLINIGTRDIQIDDVEMPAEVMQGSTLLARLAGEYLRQPTTYANVCNHISMPMVKTTLEYLGTRIKPESWLNGIKAEDLQVVLFATDQPETIAPRFRNGDTIHFARLIRDLLMDRYGVIKKNIHILLSPASPADYDQMYDFYAAELPKIATRMDGGDQAYLLIVGGTQQMNTMLLFLGSQYFGTRAHPLYVSPASNRPRCLDITRQLARQTIQRSLEVLLNRAYAYPAAIELIEREQPVLGDQTELLALLRYADQRRNFDFAAAIAMLDLPGRNTRTLRESLSQLQSELEPESEECKLRETIFLAQLARERGDWADFLARLYRFSEGSLQLFADKLGVKWGDTRERSSYHKQWWATNQHWLETLSLTEETRKSPDRRNMRVIVTHLAQQQAQSGLLLALAELEVIDKPIPLRNNIVHRFTPLSEDEVVKKAGCTTFELIAAMRASYNHQLQSVMPTTHPYTAINQLCFKLLRGER